LVLTKPLGSGIISTAIKRGICSDALALSASELMATLNKPGATLAERHLIHCCTDITGFGLAGHLIEICNGSGVSAEIHATSLPLIAPEVNDFIEKGCVPGGSLKNLAHASEQTHFAENVTEAQKTLYADAQTSGGLLLTVPDENLNAVIETLEETEAPCAVIIGKIIPRQDQAVYLIH
jgi:selenide,water dikinase